MLSPAGLPLRVRGLHAHNRAAPAAEAGQRVALNLVGISKHQVARGDWVLQPEAHAPTAQLDARIRLLPTSKPLRGDTSVHLHLAAAHVTARMAPLQGQILPGEGGPVRLTLDRGIGALAMDRLVLRDAAALTTIGGGVVLDPWPPRRGARTPARLVELAALDQPTPAAFAELLANGWVLFQSFAQARNLTETGRAALLHAAGAVLMGGFALRGEHLEQLHAALLEVLAAHHRDHPDQPGPPAERLRMAMQQRLPLPLFRALVEAVLRRGTMRQHGHWLHSPSHQLVLTPQDERIWNTVQLLIAAQRFSPPRTRDMVPPTGIAEPALRLALRRIARFGRLVEVAHDHFFLRETLAEMTTIAAQLEPLTVAAFRDRLGIGGKVAIQVLEFFDTAGVTRRQGDARRIRPERAGLFGPPQG